LTCRTGSRSSTRSEVATYAIITAILGVTRLELSTWTGSTSSGSSTRIVSFGTRSTDRTSHTL
jgi:hypothetical protein